MFKVLAITVACVSALLWAAYSLSPDRYEVWREIVIDATPAKIHPQLEDLRRWPEWSVWNTDNDPELSISYEGPSRGVDARSSWSSSQGPGSMVITASRPDSGVWYDMTFGEPGEAMPSKGAFQYYEHEGGTRVRWTASGRLEGFVPRLMGYGMDLLMGPAFEEGLAGLKALVEGPDADPGGDA